MAREIELGNVVHQTDIVASYATEAFVVADSVFPLMATQSFPGNTNVIKFPKLGKVEAQAQSESTAYTFGADDEITDTATTVTGVKKAQAQKPTIENLNFGDPHANMERYAREAGKALQRLAASDLKALFSSISGSVAATSTLTKDDLLDARYTVISGIKGAHSSNLVAFVDYKGANELAKELSSISADAFAQQVNLGGVLGIQQAGMPKGSLFDVMIYETEGLPTDSGDDIGCVWDPALAFCAGVQNSPVTFQIKPPESQEPWVELYAYTFWHIAEHNDDAACQLKSDS